MNWATEYVKTAGAGPLRYLAGGATGLGGAGLGMLAGAGVGALADPDHPFSGALGGAAVGGAGGAMLGGRWGARKADAVVDKTTHAIGKGIVSASNAVAMPKQAPASVMQNAKAQAQARHTKVQVPSLQGLSHAGNFPIEHWGAT